MRRTIQSLETGKQEDLREKEDGRSDNSIDDPVSLKDLGGSLQRRCTVASWDVVLSLEADVSYEV